MRATIAAAVGLMALVVSPAVAQAPSVTWQRVVHIDGDRGEVEAMAITPNGNIVVGGSLTRPVDFMQGEANDAWLAMYAPGGAQLWSRQLGGDVRDDIQDVAITSDGSIVVTGSRNTFYRQSAQSANSFAAKFSPAGDLLWDTIIADDAADVSLWQIMRAPDGSVLLGGQFKRFGDGGGEALVINLSPTGEIRWRAIPKSPSGPELGGFTTIKPDGRRFFTDRANLATVNAHSVEVRVRRSTFELDLDAGCVVLSLVDGKPTETLCSAASLNGFSQGNAFRGWRTSAFETADAVIAKADAAGSIVWKHILPTPEGDGVLNVAATPDGGVVGAGFRLNGDKVLRHNWDGILVRLDADGNELWRRTFGGNKREELSAVGVLPDGSIIVAGFTGSQGDGPDWAPWIMRLNPQGELEGEALKELLAKQF